MNFVNTVLSCTIFNLAMAKPKRKTLALSSDDEGNWSGILSEGDDDVPLFLPRRGKKGPTAAKAPVRNEDPLQVSQEIIAGWRLVQLDGQYVRAKLTREEMLTHYGENCAETSDEEDWDPEPDHLLEGEVQPYIDRFHDYTEDLPLLSLRPATIGANEARHAAGPLGSELIKFTSYSDKL
jgi:hypothetical protein